MRQSWRDLLFLHWSVPPEVIQNLLPKGLTVDTFDGSAFVGLVPFHMRGVRPLWSPPVPGLSAFQEVNVRTYVHHADRNPGVWFFSLDANNLVAVTIARLAFHLPYYNAAIHFRERPQGISYDVQRRRGWGGRPDARSRIEFEPLLPCPAEPGTLEHFLVERYLLYAADRTGLLVGQVHHAPYPLQTARVDRLDDTLVTAAGLPPTLFTPSPIAHFARGVDVDIYPLRRVSPGSG